MPPSSHPLFLHAQNRLHERLGDLKEPPSGDRKLILSCLDLRHDGTLPARLAAHYHALDKGGLLLAVMIGGHSLTALRDSLMEAELALTGGAQARLLPMLQASEAAQLLVETGFALPVVDKEPLELSYHSVWDMATDLAPCFAPEALTNDPVSKPLAEQATRLYPARDPEDSTCLKAPLELLFLHGWKA